MRIFVHEYLCGKTIIICFLFFAVLQCYLHDRVLIYCDVVFEKT
jgi:hypothetical protein